MPGEPVKEAKADLETRDGELKSAKSGMFHQKQVLIIKKNSARFLKQIFKAYLACHIIEI